MDQSAPLALTEDDYVRAQQLHFRRYYRTRRPQVALSFFMLSWVAFVAVTWNAPAPAPVPALVHVGVLTLVLLPFLNVFVLGPRAARRGYRSRPILGQQITYAWSEHGLRISGAQGHWQVTWQDYRRWVEDDRMFLIYQTANAYQIVPKRGLSSADQASLRQFLNQIVARPG